VTLDWRVADCAGRYLGALRRIGEEGGANLRDLWKDASRADTTMSRRWIFRSEAPRRQSRRDRASPMAAGWRAASTRRPTPDQRRLRHRAARERRIRLMIGKVADDLKTYLSQDPNPSICTGVDGFTTYYEKKLSPLGERIGEAGEAGRRRRAACPDKAELVQSVARDVPGGHPGWGGAGLPS